MRNKEFENKKNKEKLLEKLLGYDWNEEQK